MSTQFPLYIGLVKLAKLKKSSNLRQVAGQFYLDEMSPDDIGKAAL